MRRRRRRRVKCYVGDATAPKAPRRRQRRDADACVATPSASRRRRRRGDAGVIGPRRGAEGTPTHAPKAPCVACAVRRLRREGTKKNNNCLFVEVYRYGRVSLPAEQQIITGPQDFLMILMFDRILKVQHTEDYWLTVLQDLCHIRKIVQNRTKSMLIR